MDSADGVNEDNEVERLSFRRSTVVSGAAICIASASVNDRPPTHVTTALASRRFCRSTMTPPTHLRALLLKACATHHQATHNECSRMGVLRDLRMG